MSQILRDFYFYKDRLKIDSLGKAIVLLIFFNPGFQLLIAIRMQKGCSGIPIFGSLFRRFIWYWISIWTSSDISISANFGSCIYFPHPTGVVIGDSWDVGNNVTIMQGVTLGRKYSDRAPQKRSVIGDGVMISCGAKLIGEIEVGENSIVGANAVVISDVPKDSIAIGVPSRIVSKNKI